MITDETEETGQEEVQMGLQGDKSFEEVFEEAENYQSDMSELMGGKKPEEVEEEKEKPRPQPKADEEEESDDPEEEEGAGEEEEEAKKKGSEEEQEDPEEEEDEEKGEADVIPENVSTRLKKRFPDKDFDSTEEVDSAMDQLVEDSQNLESEREANKKVYDLFDSSDEMVQIARYMDHEEVGFMEALAATVDIPEAIEEMKEEDPEQYKSMIKAQAKREAKLEKETEEREELENQFVENQGQSKQNISEFQQEKEMDDDQKESFVNTIGDHFTDIVHGKITPKFMEVMHRGLNFETAVEEAREEGRIEGRNEQINTKKQKKMGDKLPKIRGGGKPTNKKTKKGTDIFDEALSPSKPISEIK